MTRIVIMVNIMYKQFSTQQLCTIFFMIHCLMQSQKHIYITGMPTSEFCIFKIQLQFQTGLNFGTNLKFICSQRSVHLVKWHAQIHVRGGNVHEDMLADLMLLQK